MRFFYAVKQGLNAMVNAEHYSDPTADLAIARADRALREKRRLERERRLRKEQTAKRDNSANKHRPE